MTQIGSFGVNGGQFVSSITGTVNQINASPSTGDVVLSISSALSLPGTMLIGGGVAAPSALFTMNSTTLGFLPPVMTTTQRNAIAAPATGLVIYNTSDSDLEVYNGVSWVGTIGSGVTSISGTTNQIVASSPTGAVTLSLNNGISVGSYQAISPPTGGLILPGRVGIGTSAPDAQSQLHINKTTNLGLFINGTNTVTSVSFIPSGIEVSPTFVAQTATNLIGIDVSCEFKADTGITVGYAIGINVYNFLDLNVQTITNSVGIYIDTGSTRSGVVTNAYGLYCRLPVGGVQNITANFEDIVCIGTTSPVVQPSAILQLDSGHAGFLPPRMTTLQKNAISAIAGLVLYDSVLNDLQFYNGAMWVGASLSGVTSITGTANQINTSGSTGAVTLSLSSTLVLPGTLSTAGTVTLSGLTASTMLLLDGSKNIVSLASGTAGKVAISNGTTWVASTPTFPNASATAGKLIRSDGTNWVAGTSTFADTYAINTILYNASANTVSGLATALNGVLITSAGGVPSWLAAGTTGQVLIATTSNPASWGTLSGIAVTSITGTANQINASASTGAVTLTLSSTIITPGTIAINGMTTGSVLFAGPSSVVTQDNTNFFWDDTNNLLGIGTATPTAKLHVAGTRASSTDSSSVQAGGFFNTAINPTGAVANAQTVYVAPSFNIGSGAITNAIGIHTAIFNVAAARNYGLYIEAPTGGSASNCATYTDNLSVGYTAVTPPSSGAIVSGQSAFGTSSAATATQVTVSGSLGNSVLINANQTALATIIGSTDQSGFRYGGTMAPSSSSGTVSPCWIGATYNAGSGQTMVTAASIYVRTLANGNQGTITTLYGLFIDTGNSGGSVITNTYGAYISSSLSGTGTSNIGVRINGSDSAASATGCRYLLNLTGLIAGDDGSFSVGIYNSVNLRPTTNNRAVYGQYNQITATAQSTNTITSAIALRCGLTVSVGSGAVSSAYSGYFENPSAGGIRIAIYTDNISIGYGASPPTNGAIISGIVGIGTSAPGTANQLNVTTALATGITVNGTQTATGTFTAANTQAGIYLANLLFPTSGSATSAGVYISSFFAAPTSQTITLGVAAYVRPNLQSNVGTITSMYCLLVDGATPGAGTAITSTWGAQFNTPTFGTTGTGNIGVQILGSDSAGATNGSKYALYLSGTITGDDSSSCYSINNTTTIRPTTNNRVAVGFNNQPTAACQSTNQISTFYAFISQPTVTIGAGSVVTAYSGYFVNPTAGATNTIALYSANLAIGYTAVSPPASGAIISGDVSIGSSSVIANTALSVSTTRSVAGNVTSNQIGIAGQITLSTPSLSSVINGTSLTTKYIASGGQTIPNVNGHYINMDPSSNAGTISAMAAIYIASGAVATGTVSRSYGLYINSQATGTTQTNIGIYLFGVDATSSTKGTSGMIKIDGFITGNESTTLYSINNRVSLNPTTTNINVYGSYNGVTAATQSTNIIPNAIAVYGLMGVDVSSGGTVNNAYSGYFAAPGGGAKQTALYADNLSIGYTAVTPPTNGAFITGSVSIGSSTNTYKLDVTGGHIGIMSIGSTLRVARGTNACSGTGAVLVAGTVTVATTAVATGDQVVVTRTTSSGTPGFPVLSIINATSFTITSTSALDTSTFSWIIFKAA